MSSACARAVGLFRRLPSVASNGRTARVATARVPSARFPAALSVRANSTEAKSSEPKTNETPFMMQFYKEHREKHLQAVQYLMKLAPGWILKAEVRDDGDCWVDIPRDKLIPLFDLLKNHSNFQFKSLMDVFSVDYPNRAERFDVLYCLLSVPLNMRMMFRLSVPQDVMVQSATQLYPSANWLEREVYDMMGIMFANHPDLRRILTDYGFQGFPLRKDFPLSGYTEVRYDDELKRVTQEPTELSQEFRAFDFSTPWERVAGPQAPQK